MLIDVIKLLLVTYSRGPETMEWIDGGVMLSCNNFTVPAAARTHHTVVSPKTGGIGQITFFYGVVSRRLVTFAVGDCRKCGKRRAAERRALPFPKKSNFADSCG